MCATCVRVQGDIYTHCLFSCAWNLKVCKVRLIMTWKTFDFDVEIYSNQFFLHTIYIVRSCTSLEVSRAIYQIRRRYVCFVQDVCHTNDGGV